MRGEKIVREEVVRRVQRSDFAVLASERGVKNSLVAVDYSDVNFMGTSERFNLRSTNVSCRLDFR